MLRKLTTDEFVEKARQIHGAKYDYSKVVYINAHEKVCIICHTHGEFWQRPYDHLKGKGCKKCSDSKKGSTQRMTTEQFISKSKEVHGDKYDYSKVEYKNNSTKVCIICPTHGEFWQIPFNHLKGCGCFKCKTDIVKNKLSHTTEQFIEKARQIHGDKYDYSKVKYKSTHEKVCITCPTHGEFWQSPSSHLKLAGCPICNGGIKSTTNEFIKKARQVHGDKYDYSKVNYINNVKKVCIICPIHGEFWQSPSKHLDGQGCLKCHISKLEILVENALKKSNIDFNFRDKQQINNLELDFFIPSKKIAIECQGIQHFEIVEYFGGNKKFEKQKENDKLKKQLCDENGIKLLYFSNLGIDYPYKVYENIDELMEEIKKSAE